MRFRDPTTTPYGKKMKNKLGLSSAKLGLARPALPSKKLRWSAMLKDIDVVFHFP